MSNLINRISILPLRAKNIAIRDFALEKMIEKAEVAKELILQLLWHFAICTVLFPNAVISNETIQFKEFLILCKPKTMKVSQINGVHIWARFPAGSVFVLKKGVLEVVHQLDFGYHPILKMLSIALNMPLEKVSNYVIDSIRKIDESLFASRQYWNYLFHRTPPMKNFFEIFVPYLTYLPLGPVIYKSPIYYSLLLEMPPLTFNNRAFDIVFDNSYAKLPPLAEKVYNFTNKHGLVETQGYKHRMSDGKFINLSVSMLQCNDTGIKTINYQSFKTPTPLYRNEFLEQHSEKEILLTHSLELADILAKHNSEIIPVSWIGKIKDVDLSRLSRRDVSFLVSSVEGLPLKESVKIAVYLMQHFNESIRFSCRVDVGNAITPQMKWDDFSRYCKEYFGLKVPVDPKDTCAIIESAVLKTSEKIMDRVVVIMGFAKYGKIYVLGGGPKTGKSFSASQIAYTISLGGEYWGFKMNKGRVLYLDTEMDDDDYKDRLLADKQHENFKIILASDIELPKEVAESEDIIRLNYTLNALHEYAVKNKFKVLFIDCMYRLLNESSGSQVNAFVNILKKMKKDGILVFVIHHLNKSDMDHIDPFKNLSGHSNFQRAVDGGILLIPNEEASKDGSRAMTAKFMARSFPQIPDKELLFENGVHRVIEGNNLPYNLTERDIVQDFVKEFIPENKEEAIPTNKLVYLMLSEWGDEKWAKSTIERHKLSEWVNAGYLKVSGQKPKKYYRGDNI